MQQLDILVVGDRSVGKTSLLNNWATGEFQGKQVPPVAPSSLYGEPQLKLGCMTNYGKFVLHCFVTMCAPFDTRFDCAVVIIDVTKKLSISNLRSWCEEIRRSNPYSKIVICGNKVNQYRSLDPFKTGNLDKLLSQFEALYCEIEANANERQMNPLQLCIQQMIQKKNVRIDSDSMEVEKISVDGFVLVSAKNGLPLESNTSGKSHACVIC